MDLRDIGLKKLAGVNLIKVESNDQLSSIEY
jgi:hypothetical protein